MSFSKNWYRSERSVRERPPLKRVASGERRQEVPAAETQPPSSGVHPVYSLCVFMWWKTASSLLAVVSDRTHRPVKQLIVGTACTEVGAIAPPAAPVTAAAGTISVFPAVTSVSRSRDDECL
ncbi:uncharacterized protein V6R79_021955 [Siganus canaliculatus]